MNRRPLLIAACAFAAVSLGLNVWLLVIRKTKSSPPAPAASGLPQDVSAAPVLQPATMDFRGTAFADGSWKLTDEPHPTVSLEKPFSWDDPLPEQAGADLIPHGASAGPEAGDLRTPGDRRKPAAADSSQPRSRIPIVPFEPRSPWIIEIPGYLDQPFPDWDPNNVRDKGLYAAPPR